MSRLKIPEKADVIAYYIEQNHTREESAAHFGLTVAQFKQSVLQKYGISKPSSARVVNIKKTLTERYGCDNPNQVTGSTERARQTNLVKYGVANPAQSTTVKAKIQATNLDRYGTTCSLHNPDIHTKVIETWRKEYGYDNPMQSQEVRDKTQATNLDRYGHTCVLQNPEIHAKTLETWRENYGTDNPLQCDSVKAKRCDTMLSKYGVPNAAQRNLPSTALAIGDDKQLFTNYVDQFESRLSQSEVARNLGVSPSWVQSRAARWELGEHFAAVPTTSVAELEIRDMLRAWGIDCAKDRTILDGFEIDIYCPDYKIGIEYNGTYWHSRLNKSRSYHLNKSRLAEKAGIRLVHIYEYEWEDPIKRPILESYLAILFGRVPQRIFARNCEVRHITNAEAKDFNNRNHLQGHRNAQVTLGLFYQGELVQLMSFSRTKYNRNLQGDNEWEIIRGCPGSNNVVVGGVSKLFAHFCREFQPSKVFSYCDYNKFDGRSYEALGMVCCGHTGPDMKWVMPDWTVVDRNPGKHKSLQEQAHTQIFGAGAKKYVWESNRKI